MIKHIYLYKYYYPKNVFLSSDNPSDKLIEAEKLLARSQEENEHLKVKIIDLQQRLLNTENKKEIITEGYGEQDDLTNDDIDEDFSQLQDRAKHVVMNGSNDTAYLLQIIEDLCRHADKSIDEMRREKEDLQHQVTYNLSFLIGLLTGWRILALKMVAYMTILL